MKRFWIFVIGLVLVFGISACQKTQEPIEPDVVGQLPTWIQPTDTPIPATVTPSPTPFEPKSPTSIPPSPTITPTQTHMPCWTEGGQIERNEMFSNWLPDPLKYRVYTPPCYLQQSDRRYPVLYLIHGQTYTDDQWDRLGVDETADVLIAEGEVPPFIVVMPYDDNFNTPPPENMFGEALLYDLIPRIDTDYRTIPDREHRTIGGLSRGGNWALHIGLSYWGFFGSIGAHSTPTFITDGPSVIRGWLAEIPMEELPRIYMDAGEDDIWLSYTLQLEDLLNQENIPHEWYLLSGQHNEEYWESHVEQYLRWYAEVW